MRWAETTRSSAGTSELGRGPRPPPRGPGSPSGCRRRRRRAGTTLGGHDWTSADSGPGPRPSQPAQRVARRARRSSASSVVAADRRHVAHLAAFEHPSLVVQVEVDGRVGQRARRPCPVEPGVARRGPRPSRLTIAVGASGVRRPERQAADRPDVLLELGGRRALDRPVAAVVDARRELVDDEPAVGHEEQLDGQRAGQAHRHAPAARRARSPGRRRPGRRRRRDALDEDARVVDVAGERVRRPCRRSCCARRRSTARPRRRSRLGEQRRHRRADRAPPSAVDLGRRPRRGPGPGRRSRRSRP